MAKLSLNGDIGLMHGRMREERVSYTNMDNQNVAAIGGLDSGLAASGGRSRVLTHYEGLERNYSDAKKFSGNQFLLYLCFLVMYIYTSHVNSIVSSTT